VRRESSTTAKIITDTDPGIDDTMAIFCAPSCPELEIVGLTTVFGTVNVDRATTNALRRLEIAGRADIPVARVASTPHARRFRGGGPHIDGADGQGDSDLALADLILAN
jgi:inosine-uridine nucleoside N-ribohydrolase